MNVTFEHTTIIISNEIPKIILELVNRIICAGNERSLRETITDYADNSDLDRHFVYGYGRNHFWLKQRKITDPDMTYDYRILIVKF